MEGLELCIGAGFFLREVPFGRCRSFRKLGNPSLLGNGKREKTKNELTM